MTLPLTSNEGGEDRMSWKRRFSWKHTLYSLATLVTLALAAGARYKPK
jgi:hypothetical protein